METKYSNFLYNLSISHYALLAKYIQNSKAKESSAAVYRGQKSMAESNAETSRKGKSGEHVVRMGEWSGVGDSQQIKTSTPRKLFSTDFFFL